MHLYVGRIAVEKNLEAFLSMPVRMGSKLVVGDGPQFPRCERSILTCISPARRFGEDLARHYASADVFVFPSRTDTFGLVLLEALASGLPVAAYPVPGPLDVIGDSAAACSTLTSRRAAERALAIPRTRCRAYALTFSWRRCAEQFLSNLHPVGSSRHPADARAAAE